MGQRGLLFTNGQQRVLIERVRPELDGGRYPVKRIVGDCFFVEADLVADGHDILGGVLRYRRLPSGDGPEGGDEDPPWEEVFLEPSEMSDRFRGSFLLSSLGVWQYTLEGWVEAFSTWQRGARRKVEAGQDISLSLKEGARLIEEAAGRAEGAEQEFLQALAREVGSDETPMERRLFLALDESLAVRISRLPDRSLSSHYPRVLEVVVDPPKARFSTWYEMFPRSCGRDGRHGTFADAERRLPYIADMGFDVLYLPPIHPIGRTHRKGRNNSLSAEPGDPGSPWAVGDETGGHKAVHPELGTLADFERFVKKANELGIEVALDIVLQTSPDHPYVREHPEWFRRLPDGSIQYAENPPKKYQDVYPFDFETPDWRALWEELASIFFFWIERGVRIFRVDNPHTKPLAFWEWCLREVKARHPEVIFLSEAFTRPALMYALAKIGFSQSYTYFTWRNSGYELRSYLEELCHTEIAEFFRPNFWPNTPDILPEHLQTGLRSVFLARLILAATLSSNYGIYGPAFELMEHIARPGSEEYLDNEKYEIKRWDLGRADSLRHIIRRLNAIRRENPALQEMGGLRFHHTDHDLILCYSKESRDGENVVLVVVNLDPHHTHSTWVDVNLPGLSEGGKSFQMHDLLSDARYLWQGRRNFVELNPGIMPAHIFRVRRFVRSEHNFEYYL